MDKSRVEPTIFFIEKISFLLKLFSGHFYGQSFIKTVRGPFNRTFCEQTVETLTGFVASGLGLHCLPMSHKRTLVSNGLNLFHT